MIQDNVTYRHHAPLLSHCLNHSSNVLQTGLDPVLGAEGGVEPELVREGVGGVGVAQPLYRSEVYHVVAGPDTQYNDEGGRQGWVLLVSNLQLVSPSGDPAQELGEDGLADDTLEGEEEVGVDGDDAVGEDLLAGTDHEVEGARLGELQLPHFLVALNLTGQDVSDTGRAHLENVLVLVSLELFSIFWVVDQQTQSLMLEELRSQLEDDRPTLLHF